MSEWVKQAKVLNAERVLIETEYQDFLRKTSQTELEIREIKEQLSQAKKLQKKLNDASNKLFLIPIRFFKNFSQKKTQENSYEQLFNCFFSILSNKQINQQKFDEFFSREALKGLFSRLHLDKLKKQLVADTKKKY